MLDSCFMLKTSPQTPQRDLGDTKYLLAINLQPAVLILTVLLAPGSTNIMFKAQIALSSSFHLKQILMLSLVLHIHSTSGSCVKALWLLSRWFPLMENHN